MRIGLLTAWLSRANGGVFEAVVAQAELVRSLGHEPVVIGLADAHGEADRARFGGCEVRALPVRGPRMIGLAPAMPAALDEARLDLLHLHGIWMYPSAAGAAWARATGRPYVISPHGMMDPWILARGRLKKAAAKFVYERESWRRAALFHALTADEAMDIAALAGSGECVVVPNAVEPAPVDGPREPVALYLGRIHPKKNLAALVAGWRLARDRLAGAARLVIAGWGEPRHVAALEALVADDPDIAFLGPAYGADKARLLASARFLALPSHSEGLPMAVLEAWAAGTPTLISRHCHMPEGYAAGAALDCGTSAKEVAEALADAFALEEGKWRTMADAAAALVRERFAPEVVSRRWRTVYDGLMQRDPA